MAKPKRRSVRHEAKQWYRFVRWQGFQVLKQVPKWRRQARGQAIRAWTSVADSSYWVVWQVRAHEMRVTRQLFGRRATLLARPEEADPAKPVVVSLAGLLTSWEFLTPLNDALVERGFQVAVVPQLGLNTKSVQYLAEHVKRFLRTHGDLTPVVFVSHSKGGLVAKRVLLDDPDFRYAVGAVTLAAPFAGATTAKYVRGLTPLTREVVTLRPGTPAQLELEHMDAQDRRISAISPIYDEIVGLRGKVRGGSNRAVSTLGHNRLLSDPRIHGLVEREIIRLWDEWQAHSNASKTSPPTPA
ncbi:esterase/lipase family protein [Gulosibacter molinativorax]|uniref:Alpha/beta hydrolase n=1 Tax=Gulosibacter molinativorax TaxID=256821 RepID=A0ABT7C8Y5_9MICO|nr:alpha/beta hydrolase [Gulosibacter molinativorax]MDJ1371647.1 hypothetical protein [Gulosibacter molinativorax]QUY61009.1 Hypotetical protein [Gulosibacter molinativorax]